MSICIVSCKVIERFKYGVTFDMRRQSQGQLFGLLTKPRTLTGALEASSNSEGYFEIGHVEVAR